MTERIVNIMLNGAVCVSDRSSRLDHLFHNNKDIVLFDLENPDEMVQRIKALLNDNEKRLNIARLGFNNAYANHQWINRVDDMIKINSQ